MTDFLKHFMRSFEKNLLDLLVKVKVDKGHHCFGKYFEIRREHFTK